MGSSLASDEQPAHHVKIRTFAAGKFHVTRGQFAAFVTDSGYDTGKSCFTFEEKSWQKRKNRDWRKPGFEQDDHHPAVCISWHDAKAYTDWLAKKTGKSYRLLSEAEWEYAARATTLTTRYWGDQINQACSYANGMDTTGKDKIPGVFWAAADCRDGFAYTSPVGQFTPNAFGLYDMLGNAWQWVEDNYAENYQDSPTDGSALTGDIRQAHVMRGGAWSGMPDVLRSSKRNKYDPSGRFSFVGFRVASDIEKSIAVHPEAKPDSSLIQNDKQKIQIRNSKLQ